MVKPTKGTETVFDEFLMRLSMSEAAESDAFFGEIPKQPGFWRMGIEKPHSFWYDFYDTALLRKAAGSLSGSAIWRVHIGFGGWL